MDERIVNPYHRLDACQNLRRNKQRKGTSFCTSHYIREQIVDEIILQKLKEMTAFAREQPKEFYAMATQNGEADTRASARIYPPHRSVRKRNEILTHRQKSYCYLLHIQAATTETSDCRKCPTDAHLDKHEISA